MSTHRLSVHVRDDEARALEGVQVRVESSRGSSILGVTGTQGELECTVPLGKSQELIASLHSRWEARASLSDDVDEYDVVIDTGGKIRGVVLKSSGPPVEAGTIVLAWRVGTSRTQRELAEGALLGNPDVNFATTDASGGFELRGLERGKRYSMAAGGHGWTHHERLKNVTPDGPHLTIELDRLYAGVVEFFDAEADAPVRIPANWWAWLAIETSIGDSSVHRVIANAGTTLAGVPTDLRRVGIPMNREVALCTSTGTVEALGPFSLKAAYPGYLPVELQYFVKPLDQGLHVERVYLERACEGWGRLRIAITGAGNLEFGDVQTAVDTHLLKLTDVDHREFRYGVDDLRREEIWIDDIPFGEYAAVLEVNYGATRLPSSGPVSLSIGESPATLHVDLTGLGAILVKAVRNDGVEWEESAAVAIGSHGHGLGMPIVLRRRPYLLPWLRPGDYDVQLNLPFVATPPSEPVTVRAGEITTFEIVER